MHYHIEPETDNMKYGIAVANIRMQIGMTQKQFAEACQIGYSTLQHIEQGLLHQTPRTVGRINSYLDMRYQESMDPDPTFENIIIEKCGSEFFEYHSIISSLDQIFDLSRLTQKKERKIYVQYLSGVLQSLSNICSDEKDVICFHGSSKLGYKYSNMYNSILRCRDNLHKEIDH